MGVKEKSFIVKYYKEALIVILILLLCGFGKKHFELIDLNEQLAHKGDSLYTVARYYKNKEGKLVQQVSVSELTIKDLKKIGNSLGFQNGELKKQVGNLNNLVGYWKGQAGFKGSDTVKLHDTVRVFNGETVTAQSFKWTNKYLSIDGDFLDTGDNTFDLGPTLVFNYSYDIGGFELTAYRKKQGLFGRKQLVADIKFGDQNMKVREFTGVVVSEPKKKLIERPLFWGFVGLVGGVFIAK